MWWLILLGAGKPSRNGRPKIKTLIFKGFSFKRCQSIQFIIFLWFVINDTYQKSDCPQELSKDDFFLGSKIVIYSRELDIVDFGDAATRDLFSYHKQQVFIILTSDSYSSWGKMIHELVAVDGFSIVKMKSVQLSHSVSDGICKILDIHARNNNPKFVEGVSLAMIIQRVDALQTLQSISSDIIQKFQCELYFTKTNTETSSADEIIFNSMVSNSSTLDSCTCVIIKPHHVKLKQTGLILDFIISQGYEVSAIQSIHFEKVSIEMRLFKY